MDLRGWGVGEGGVCGFHNPGFRIEYNVNSRNSSMWSLIPFAISIYSHAPVIVKCYLNCAIITGRGVEACSSLVILAVNPQTACDCERPSYPRGHSLSQILAKAQPGRDPVTPANSVRPSDPYMWQQTQPCQAGLVCKLPIGWTSMSVIPMSRQKGEFRDLIRFYRFAIKL